MNSMLTKEIKRIIKLKYPRLIFAFISSQIVPLLETSLIFIIYIILEPERLNVAFNKLSEISTVYFPKIVQNQQDFSIFITALAFGLLFFQMILKYQRDMNLVNLCYFLYVRDASRLIKGYLKQNFFNISEIKKERIISSILHDSGILGNIIKIGFDIIGALIQIVFYVIFMIFVSAKMTAVSLSLFLVPGILSKIYSNKLKHVGELKIKSNENLLSYFSDILSGIKRIKYDSLEKHFANKSIPVLEQSQRWRILKRQTLSKINIILEGLSLFSFLIIVLIGTVLLNVKLSTLLIIFIVFSRIRSLSSIIISSYSRIKEFLPQVNRYFSLSKYINFKSTIEDVSSSKRVIKIHFDNVDFSYGSNNILEDINITFSAGDRILIKGPSGIGKSTFVDLLCGLNSPNKGTIKYFDEKNKAISLGNVRNQTIVISPEIYLFNTSIMDNLIFDNESDIDFALKSTFIDDVVNELPAKLNSKIGYNGDELSLGQRQRLILSRLFISRTKPKIILLDEATGNIDVVLEEKVINNILSYIDSNAILIMISHREPNNIKFNRKLYLKNKNISEKELMYD